MNLKKKWGLITAIRKGKKYRKYLTVFAKVLYNLKLLRINFLDLWFLNLAHMHKMAKNGFLANQ